MKVREDGQETQPYHIFLFLYPHVLLYFRLSYHLFYFMILKLLFWL